MGYVPTRTSRYISAYNAIRRSNGSSATEFGARVREARGGFMDVGRRGAVPGIGLKGLAAGGVLAVVAALLGVTAGPAQAANFSGGFSPPGFYRPAPPHRDNQKNRRGES